MRDTFAQYHPVVNFTYFMCVLLFAMCFINPIGLAISLISSVCYATYLNGKKSVRFTAAFLLPMLLMAAIINPAFNHEGVTTLAYLPSGNPLTLESMVYGVAAGAMIAGVVMWFSCYTAVMTSDKFVYLFGKVIPALSLVLSMTLRFVPKFKTQIAMVTESQITIGRDPSQGSILHRAKIGISILSIMITWSLENAIETADSMRSRGYGLPNRSAFSIFTFDDRDKMMMCWIGFCGFTIISAWISGAFEFLYFPAMTSVSFEPLALFFQLIYLLLCFTPLILNITEDYKWKKLKMEI